MFKQFSTGALRKKPLYSQHVLEEEQMTVIVDNLKEIRDFFLRPDTEMPLEKLDRYYNTLDSLVKSFNSIDDLEGKYIQTIKVSLEKDYGIGSDSKFCSWEELAADPMRDTLLDIVLNSYLTSSKTLLNDCIRNYKNHIVRLSDSQATQEYITWLIGICKRNFDELSRNEEHELASYYTSAINSLNSL
jgi:hypothetical protein